MPIAGAGVARGGKVGACLGWDTLPRPESALRSILKGAIFGRLTRRPRGERRQSSPAAGATAEQAPKRRPI
jgi:hypothetical protein